MPKKKPKISAPILCTKRDRCIYSKNCPHDLRPISPYFDCYERIKDGRGMMASTTWNKKRREKEENERTQGKWEINCDGYYPYCSICKAEPKNGVMSDYCPNCGARMKGANT